MAEQNRSGEVIIVVLDPFYGDRLRDLPHTGHVWAVLSPVNEVVIRELWAGASRSELSASLTGMQMVAEMNIEDYLVGELATIDLHHPACTEIIAIGIAIGNPVLKALHEMGFTEIVPMESGFHAFRRSTSPD